MKLFVLSKKDIGLSVSEVRSRYSGKDIVFHEDYLFVNSRSKKYTRLAYTKEVYKILESTGKKTQSDKETGRFIQPEAAIRAL